MCLVLSAASYCMCLQMSDIFYYKYKGLFSVFLIVLVDAHYKSMWVDIGGMNMFDYQIFKEYQLKKCFKDGSFIFPEPESLPFYDYEMPHFLLRDDDVGLHTFLFKRTKHLYIPNAMRDSTFS